MLKVIILLYSYILARPDHNDMHVYVYAFANSIANTIRAYQEVMSSIFNYRERK